MPWNTGPTSRGIMARHGVESAIASCRRTGVGSKKLSQVFGSGMPLSRIFMESVLSVFLITAVHKIRAKALDNIGSNHRFSYFLKVKLDRIFNILARR